MATRYLYKDVLPCIAMVSVELSNVFINILFKAASSKGMNYFVFIAYSDALATLALLPLTFFFIRKAGFPPFKFSFISRMCLLGLIGFSSQLFQYKGLELGSPTLSSAISNVIPAFTFILAVFFRMEKVVLPSSSTTAKIIGTVASISGALIVVLYKGSQVVSSTHSTSLSMLPNYPHQLGSSQSNWVIAGLILILAYLCSSFWYILQSQIMKIYPEEIVVVFLYNLSTTILSLPVCLLAGANSNMSSWRLRTSIEAASILYAGIFALSFSSCVHTWGVRLKGPVYVAIFRPLSIVIAAIMSFIFLGEALYLGSVIGALILAAGLYAVLWGKSKEEEMLYDDSGNLYSCDSPFLQSRNPEEM